MNQSNVQNIRYKFSLTYGEIVYILYINSLYIFLLILLCKSIHKKDTIMPRKKQVYESLECFICRQIFARKMFNLKRHMDLHGPSVNLVKCTGCAKTFQNKANHKTHWLKKHAEHRRNVVDNPVTFAEPAKSKIIKRNYFMQTKSDNKYSITNFCFSRTRISIRSTGWPNTTKKTIIKIGNVCYIHHICFSIDRFLNQIFFPI